MTSTESTTVDLARAEIEATLMFAEAGFAGAAVAQFLNRNTEAIVALGARLRAYPPNVIVTCARGSSDHAATYGKYLFETALGIPVSSAAPSVSSVFAAPSIARNALCVALSQSGRSPDLLAAVETYKRAGAYIVVLVNDEGSALAKLADTLLPLDAGPELSVAATKSYIVMLAALAAIAAAWAQDDDLAREVRSLPATLPKAFAIDWTDAVDAFAGARNLFVIGRGYGLGVTQEAALKLKETCALHAEAFSAAEVRHGPMAIVDAGFPILGFATSDAAGDSVRAMASDFEARGAVVRIADARPGASAHLPAISAHPAVEPILMIQSFYRLANALSIRRGLDPDAPPHLAKVTRTI